MTPYTPFFALTIFAISFLTGYLLRLRFRIPTPAGRNESIDGLRGFLALGVFIHHTAIWFQYIHTGKWEAPVSNLYSQLGQASVSLFFMITSFLFVNKLVNAGKNGLQWRSFFISRVFRLVPMYLFSISLVILLVMLISQWRLNTNLPDLIGSVFQWCIFTINQSPAINNFSHIYLVNAGVEWSLPYEWFFYFSLPIISLFLLKTKPKNKYLLLSILLVITFYYVHSIIYFHLYSFMCGAIAPLLLKYTSFHKKIPDFLLSVTMVVSLYFVGRFHTADNMLCISFIAVLFNCVALGGTFFGLLKNNNLKFLGDICYSTYLLHGILLFAVYYVGIGLPQMNLLTPLQYCLLVFALTPVIVVASLLGFKYIEKPFIDRAKEITHILDITGKINGAVYGVYEKIRKAFSVSLPRRMVTWLNES